MYRCVMCRVCVSLWSLDVMLLFTLSAVLLFHGPRALKMLPLLHKVPLV